MTARVEEQRLVSNNMASLDTAIRLVTQAVHQDQSKNYEEAARCYREAIALFRSIARSKSVTPRVRQAVQVKCQEYETRLKKIDQYLFNKADLTKLFKDCVQFNQCAYSRPSSETEELYNSNPFLRKGLEQIEKGKRLDSQNRFSEALRSYEEGTDLLLDAVNRGKVSEFQRDAVRSKCLLIHDRKEIIRNYLDYGEPLKIRKEGLNSLENSLSSTSGSPTPALDEEDRTFLMEEIKSNYAGSVCGDVVRSVAASTQSLYPMVVEIKRSPSVISGHSDFDTVEGPCTVREKHVSPTTSIPLADLDKELQLSNLSLRSEATSIRSRSLHASVEDIRRTDSILVLGEDGKLTDVSFGEQDRNVTELTYMNSEIDSETYKAYLQEETSSDSGISDRSPDSEPQKTPDARSLGGRDSVDHQRKSPVSDTYSLDIVPSLPLLQPTPTKQSPVSSSRSSPATRRRRTPRSLQASVDKLEVLTADEIVMVDKHNPPRAYARDHEEEEDINKGCFYLMSCLDCMWIL